MSDNKSFRKPPKAQPNQQLKLGKAKANTTFVQYRKNEDEPTGIRVRSHPDYAAELQAEKDAALQAGEIWYDSEQRFFEKLRG